jgi:16S rRNA (uracil1498-N3)-methyltransferase
VRVSLVDGQGARGEGVLTQLAKRHAVVSVESAERVPQSPAVHLLLPVADKDRMLWLAEKATELELTSWRPVWFRRSKNVNPRGEGTTFQQRVRSRMGGALEQSRGAWLPVAFPEATVEHAIAATPQGVRLILHLGGAPFATTLERRLTEARRAGRPGSPPPAVTLAVGPEGGFEQSEVDALVRAGFESVEIGRNIMRFETAAMAAISISRALLETT